MHCHSGIKFGGFQLLAVDELCAEFELSRLVTCNCSSTKPVFYIIKGGWRRYCERSNTSKFRSVCLVVNTIVVKRVIRSLYVNTCRTLLYMRNFFDYITHISNVGCLATKWEWHQKLLLYTIFCTDKWQTADRIKYIIALIHKRCKSNNLNMQ